VESKSTISICEHFTRHMTGLLQNM